MLMLMLTEVVVAMVAMVGMVGMEVMVDLVMEQVVHFLVQPWD